MIKSATLVMFCITYAGSAALSESAESTDQDTNTQAIIETKTELQIEYGANACRATHQLVYDQRGASVRVVSTFTNDQCAASSGTYTLHVIYRDDSGADHSKDFLGSWQRSDALPVSFQKDYFVAENVDIVRVKARKLTCFCDTNEPADQAPLRQESLNPDS